jgi:NAD(P)-dependent dehydrogenase (short-subunit alcohol dehydrogenase family)
MALHPTVFITGASRGIGHATAKYFVDQGWRAITCSRDKVPPQCGRDDRHMHITADLSRVENLEIAIGQLSEILGDAKLSALVNNAGFSPKGPDGKRLGCLDGELGHWQEVFAINFFAPVFFSRTLAKRLQEGEGSIVNITSIAGHRVHPFAGSAYSTSKAALWALTRELAADLAPMGIRVNAVCPGEINTAILSPGTDQLVSRIPLRRLGSPTEVAAVIFYLCSTQASYVTGAEIPVNGGQDVY